MNYQRVKMQAFIKSKLKEKSEQLRKLKGSEKQRAEELVIKQAKEEFMGYKNSKQKKNEEKPVEPAPQAPVQPPVEPIEPQEPQEPTEPSEPSEGEEREMTDEEALDENGHPLKNELKFEEMSEEELRSFAEENKIDLGNASSVAGIIKKIKKASE